MPISCTVAWSSATKEDRKRAKSVFSIPKNAKSVLFPSRHDSLWPMLRFDLPRLSPSRSKVSEPNQLFSTLSPDEDTSETIHKLRKLPLPDIPTIQQLDKISHEYFLNGAESIQYAHITGEETLFPLWVISYWTLIWMHLSHVRKPWLRDLDWLNGLRNQRSNESLRAEAEETYQMLDSVGWTTPKAGFADKLPIHSIWRALGTSWMNSTIVDNALEVLCARIEDSHKLSSQFVVQNTDFLDKLVSVLGGDDKNTDGYLSCGWLDSVGKQVFEEGKTFVTIAHLGKLPPRKGEKVGLDHWVPVAVDGKHCCFLYGDSLCGKKALIMPPKLLKIVMLSGWSGFSGFRVG